jgi:hypothetical protein
MAGRPAKGWTDFMDAVEWSSSTDLELYYSYPKVEPYASSAHPTPS